MREPTMRPNGGAANPYGAAAAACILYSTGYFPREAAERAAFVTNLQAGQAADTGLFSEPSHNTTHATAYVLAALELFDAGARYPLTALRPLLAPGAIEQLLEELDWRKPWGASHYGAGSFAALYLAGDASPAWQDRYFNWLWQAQDARTGLWRKDASPPLFDSLAAGFHYLFNHVCLRRPIRYPQAMIDTALQLRRERQPVLGKGAGFSELDWLYCLTRPVRQCGYRYHEAMQELQDFAREYSANLLALVSTHSEPFPDLHALNGTISALAELQQALPGLLRCSHPLKLTLDRGPFI